MTTALTDADRAVEAGLELVGIVREYCRDTITEWVRQRDRLALEQMVVALAAMVPDDRSARELLDWCDPAHTAADRRLATLRRLAGKPQRIAECGTRSGYARHKNRSEEVCEPCVLAERLYQRNKQREVRRKAKQAAA